MRKNISQISIFVVISVFCAYFLLSNLRSFEEEGSTVKVHVTLYVGGELLRDGGTVIVASIPLPKNEFLALEGENLAAEDPNNAKRAALLHGDVLLGARVSGRVNFVEMYYIEGGSFGFNFVVDPNENTGRTLVTERILVGDGGWTNWATGENHVWPDVSTIYIEGPKSSKREGQLVRSVQGKILNLVPPSTKYRAITVLTPTNEQLDQGTWGKFYE